MRHSITLMAVALLGGACGGGGSSGGEQVLGFAIQTDSQSVTSDSGLHHEVGITVARNADFSEAVDLSVEGTSADVSASVTPATLTSGSGTLTIDISPTATPASHEITVVGRSASFTRSRTVTVHALPTSNSNGLTLSLPTRMSIRAGQSSACMLEIARSTGAVGDIALSINPLVDGPIASMLTNPTPHDSSVLSIDVAAGVAPGIYPVVVSGSVGGDDGTAACLVEVVESAAATDRWINRIEYAQSYFSNDLEFVRGRDVFVRAHVLADRAGTASPRVELVASSGAAELGRFDMTGPATLPTAEDPTSLSASFTGEIPAAWVQPGLQLSVELDPDDTAPDRVPANDLVTDAPDIGGGPDVEVVVVPLILNGRTAAPVDFQDALFAYWPVESINVTVRAPYTIMSVADVQANGTGWSEVLSEVAALRASDGSSAYYYGAIDLPYGAGVFGLGYVGFPASIGSDTSVATMVHEIGHNFGLSHAPCGGAAGTDPNYPHGGGIVGSWGFDSRTDQLIAPTSRNDIMGYCGFRWISSYHYERVRRRIDTGSLVLTSILGGGDPEPLVTIDGWLSDDGELTLDAPRRHVSVKPPVLVIGSHELRTTFGGTTTAHPIELHELGCGATDPRGRRFSVTIPDPGNLSRVGIWSDGAKLDEVAAAPVDADAGLSWTEAGGVLTATWDADAYPTASVVCYGVKRMTLALHAGGGALEIDTSGLPAGGSFEFSFETKLDGHCIAVAR